MIWYGMVWYGMVWYRIVSYGIVPYRIVSYCVVYFIVSYRIVSYHIISHIISYIILYYYHIIHGLVCMNITQHQLHMSVQARFTACLSLSCNFGTNMKLTINLMDPGVKPAECI